MTLESFTHAAIFRVCGPATRRRKGLHWHARPEPRCSVYVVFFFYETYSGETIILFVERL